MQNAEAEIFSNLTSFLKFVLNKSAKHGLPQTMTYDDNMLNDINVIICNSFGHFFRVVYTNTACIKSNFVPSIRDNLNCVHVRLVDIEETLNGRNTRKGPGSNELPPILYKKCRQSLISPLHIIFP